MRHIATLVCGLFVVGSLAACGDDNDDTADTAAPTTEAAAETEAPDDDEQPTLGFDGATATYRGPSTLTAGEVTFALENDSDIDVDFVWGRHSEVGHTLDELVAWNDENPGVKPPYIEFSRDIGDTVPAGTATEETQELAPGPHDFVVHDEATGMTWIAGVVQVTDE